MTFALVSLVVVLGFMFALVAYCFKRQAHFTDRCLNAALAESHAEFMQAERLTNPPPKPKLQSVVGRKQPVGLAAD